MVNHLRNVRATLMEEIRLLDEMIQRADEVRMALVERSTNQLFSISAQQQTQMMRLRIIRQTQERVLESILQDFGETIEMNGTGLRALLEALGARNEIRILNEVELRIANLAAANTVNSRLLEKQYNSVSAFQQLMDLISGVEKVYDRQGSVVPTIPGQHFEHRG